MCRSTRMYSIASFRHVKLGPGRQAAIKRLDNHSYRQAVRKAMHRAYVNDAWDEFYDPCWDYITDPWAWDWS